MKINFMNNKTNNKSWKRNITKINKTKKKNFKLHLLNNKINNKSWNQNITKKKKKWQRKQNLQHLILNLMINKVLMILY